MEKEFILSFGKVIIHNSIIAEFIPEEGAEIEIHETIELNGFIVNHMPSRIGLILTVPHSYTYSLNAMMEIGKLTKVIAIAAITKTTAAETISNLIFELREDENRNMKIFYGHDAVAEWINNSIMQNQQEISTNSKFTKRTKTLEISL